MSLATDIAAITILDADEAGAGDEAAKGYSARANLDCIVKSIDDTRRRLNDLYLRLPNGTAKTAVGTAITNVG